MKLPLPTEQEAECVPDPGWMYCRQEMSFAPTQNWTPDCLAHIPLTLLTILAQLLKIYYNFARYNTLQCPDLKNAFQYFIKQDLVCGAIKQFQVWMQMTQLLQAQIYFTKWRVKSDKSSSAWNKDVAHVNVQ